MSSSPLPVLSVVRIILIGLIAVPPAVTSAQEKGWHRETIPNAWRTVPKGELAPIHGYSWYRALVVIPESWKGDELALYIEAMDDARATYVNGQLVGIAGAFPPKFRSGLGESGQYVVGEGLLRFGNVNTVAIRVYQNDPRPNFSVAPPVLLNRNDSEAIRLEGTWQYRPGDDLEWSKATLAQFTDSSLESISDSSSSNGIYRRVDKVDDVNRYVTKREGDTDPLSPSESVKCFKTPEDLEVQLVLADPDIAQPLFMSWDARGRMWLAEYRQYPDPAGLKMVSRDVFLRSVYDKVPIAPPHHVKGQDRISIHEDTDGDGVYDSHKIFVDGLNLATSCAIGRGGVFVTNPPYLLFYSDANKDDVPDGDPEVLLEGFGIEDSHSVINSLRFGPDGWLYGAQGSTVSANVRKPGAKEPLIRTVGQLIWRYHPERKEFEVFAEGGGNTFGCELDAHGEVFSGHNGGDTRGFHYVQGGYYRKGFGKHGPLSNPYAFGFFENIKHHNVARFTHNFIVYEEQGLPERYRGKLFGIEPLQGQVVLSDLKPMLSSFESKDIERVVTSSDPWFRPVDIKAGPNGSIYIADMYEQRIDHSSHYAGRVDRSNGRVYALRPKDTTRSKPFDYARLPSEEQIQLLNHPSKWHRQTAVRLIGDHPKDFPSKASILRQIQENREHSLDALWALNAIEGMHADDALPFLEHSNPWVRAWTIRMVVDASNRMPAFVRKLEDLSKHDRSVIVRKQLACSAKRLSPQDALPILSQLVQHDGDAEDLHQPLLVWWALERHLGEADVSTWIQGILGNADGWHRPMVARHLLSRWMKRYASTGKREDLARASRLLSAAPDRISSDLLLQGFEEAYQGRSLASIPIELTQAIASSGGGSLALRMRQGDPQAIQEGLALVVHPKEKKGLKKQLMEVMGQVAKAEFLPTLLQVVSNEKDMELVSASIGALHAYGSDDVARTVLHRYPSMSSEAKLSAEALLALRLSTSRLLVSSVEAKQIEKTDLAQSTLRTMLLHQDKDLAKRIEIVWGPIQGASSSQMLEEIKRVTQVLQEGTGNPKQGKLLFAQHCGRCHRLFEEGGGIGPDLSPFARDNVERMLVNIINPSLEIREGFENHVLTTIDGKVLTGFVADRDQQVVVLRGVDGQNTVVPKEEIEVLKAIPQSVMPEGTLKPLADQPLRDLFAYLRANQPVN